MKASTFLKGILPVLVLLVATSAFAASKGPLQVTNNVTVAGKALAAGDYTVQWQGTGPGVELAIMQGKKLVVTVPATLVNLEQSPAYNAAVVTTGGDGSRTLSQIRFSGKKQALAIGADAGSGASAGGSSSN